MTDTGSKSRTQVLGAIRGHLGTGGSAPARQAAVKARLAGQARHLVPERSKQSPERLKALFSEQLRAGFATVIEAAGPHDVPKAIADYLRGANLPLRLRCGDDAWLAALDWQREPALSLQKGRAHGDDDVGLTHALAGIAETGTLMLASGPDNPVTANFLPETSIIIVEASDLVGPYEDAFERLRTQRGRGVMPRTLNMISGPSRTADVGGRLVTGAHGPRRLCIVIVG